MIKPILRAFAVLVIGVAVALASPFAQEAPSSSPVKWEYRVLSRDQIAELGKNDLAAGLNRLGEDGWQLVTVEPAFTPEKNSTVPARAAQYYLIRPKDYPRIQRETAQRRVASAKADLEMCEDRAAWSERMVKKGYLTATQARVDQEQLRRARAALEAAERELNSVIPKPELPRPKEQK